MARGIARVMGFRMMRNFNNPYAATGLGDFWARWHISLSTWFKDYLYFPLGGSRHGTLFTYRNMILTMVISGVWHGSKWTFVTWGLIHALGRCLTRELEQTSFYKHRVPTAVKQAWVFVFVCFAWIFFRRKSMEDAWLIIQRMATTGWSDPRFPLMVLVLVLAVWAYQLLYTSTLSWRAVLRAPAVRVGLAILMVLYLAIVAQPSNKAFIYFQF